MGFPHHQIMVLQNGNPAMGVLRKKCRIAESTMHSAYKFSCVVKLKLCNEPKYFLDIQRTLTTPNNETGLAFQHFLSRAWPKDAQYLSGRSNLATASLRT